jgi:hypothetical protein
MARMQGRGMNKFYFFRLLLILRMGAALLIMVCRECSWSALPLQRIQPSLDLSTIFPSAQEKVAAKISGDCSLSMFIGGGLAGAGKHFLQ